MITDATADVDAVTEVTSLALATAAATSSGFCSCSPAVETAIRTADAVTSLAAETTDAC